MPQSKSLQPRKSQTSYDFFEVPSLNYAIFVMSIERRKFLDVFEVQNILLVLLRSAVEQMLLRIRPNDAICSDVRNDHSTFCAVNTGADPGVRITAQPIHTPHVV